MASNKKRITETQKRIIRKLMAENYSYTTIAKVMGLNPNTVKSVCFRKGVETPSIPRKTKTEKAQLRVCKQCGTPIDNPWNRVGKQFCSDKCRRRYWNEHNDSSKESVAFTGTGRPQKDARLPAPPEVSLYARR